MQTVAFYSQKGGSGKTTLTVHTAVAASEAGERVVVVDTDRQQSAMMWRETREQDAPVVVAVAASSLEDVMNAARHDAMTLCIVDTAPHIAPDAARVAAVADLVIIPCRPTAFDLAAAASAVEIIRAAKVPAAFVLSACPFRAPEIEEARSALAVHGFPIAPVAITDRRAFSRAVATGRAVTEFEADSKAAEEIRALWNWIKEQLTHGETNRAGGVRQQSQEHARRAR